MRFGFRTLAAIAALAFTLSANAAPVMYGTQLNGASEAPPNASRGVGTALVTIDLAIAQLTVDATFFGLTGNTSASHIHCCTAEPGTGTAAVATTVPSFPGFPLGVTSGSFHQVYDLNAASSYNPAFVTSSGGLAAARDLLVAGLIAGTTYFNIHTTAFPAGEIRGFLLPATAVPEPGTVALLAGSLIALAFVMRRQSPKFSGRPT